MKISQYDKLLEKGLPKKRRILGVGKPGVGKTYVHGQVCRRLGWDYIPICAPLQSPVKIGGYPRPPAIEGGDATHALFDGIASAMRATKPTYLVFDDLGMAGGETLKAIVDLVQFGRIDSRTLPDCVVIGGATNDVGHGADVVGLIEPLKTRWHTIVNIEPSLEDSVGFGLVNGWPTDLCAFLRNSPESLHDWKPSKSMSIDGACPRGWEYVAGWINDGIDDPEVIAGCVGKGAATKYLAYRALANELPDVDSLLMSPDTAPVPENPSARYLVSMALASKLSAQNFGQAMVYLQRLPQMFRALTIKDAFNAQHMRRSEGAAMPKGWAPIETSRDFTAWLLTEDGKEVIGVAGRD